VVTIAERLARAGARFHRPRIEHGAFQEIAGHEPAEHQRGEPGGQALEIILITGRPHANAVGESQTFERDAVEEVVHAEPAGPARARHHEHEAFVGLALAQPLEQAAECQRHRQAFFAGGLAAAEPQEGFALLETMAHLGFILDVAHMDEKALMQALDFYPGRIVSTHANVQSLLKDQDSNRHLSERAIQGLLERDAILGLSPVNSFLLAGWKRGDRRELVSLQRLADHIDNICQAAGDARHAGLGSDFDGGFGVQSVPIEVDTIADLTKLANILAERGFSQTDIAAILGVNWLEMLKSALPENV